MAWLRRKKNVDTTLPEEVQTYYKGERRERTSVAWLLAIGTLIVTLLVAFLLFWVGRWAYRALTDNDTKPKTPNSAATQPVSGGKTDSAAATTSTPSTGTTSTTTTSAATTPAAQSTPKPTTVPNTGPSETPTTLINTGPSDDPSLN